MEKGFFNKICYYQRAYHFLVDYALLYQEHIGNVIYLASAFKTENLTLKLMNMENEIQINEYKYDSC